MTILEYQPGDKVIIIDDRPRNDIFGKVYTIKKKKGYGSDLYLFEEVSFGLLPKRFKHYIPQDPNMPAPYDGWVNEATNYAAMVFFNDGDLIRKVRNLIVDGPHAGTSQAMNVIHHADIPSHINREAICTRAILEQWLKSELNNVNLSNSRYNAVISDLKAWDYMKMSKEDQAYAIADKNHKSNLAAEQLFPPIEKKKEKEFMMKLETKHYVNDKELSSMSTEERIQVLADTEAHINKLKEVRVKSKLVDAEIEKAQTFLDNAVKLFDGE
jgi:hypothetical protein